MSKSIHSTTPQFEKQKVPRFRRLDNDHIQALESVFKKYDFLNNRIEIHMPFNRAKNAFSNESVWVWSKFDKRPVGYLIFIDGFPPCIWHPERQEGLTLRWLLPPNFCQSGPTICLANILSGESTLQVEDLVIYEGKDLWSTMKFSKRWEQLRDFWSRLPPDQPLLAFKPRIVKPLTLDEWSLHYDPSLYWTIQTDSYRSPRWFWRDSVTPLKTIDYIPPTLKRNTEVTTILCALCKPYDKMHLPDTYSLYSQEGNNIGIAGISSIELSKELRRAITENKQGVPVEVKWNDQFSKYQISKLLPLDTSVTTFSFFNKSS